jgi:hypothetical protein
MQRLLVLYFIRAGYLGVTVQTIVDAARSAGAVAGIKADRTEFQCLSKLAVEGTAESRTGARLDHSRHSRCQ